MLSQRTWIFHRLEQSKRLLKQRNAALRQVTRYEQLARGIKN